MDLPDLDWKARRLSIRHRVHAKRKKQNHIKTSFEQLLKEHPHLEGKIKRTENPQRHLEIKPADMNQHMMCNSDVINGKDVGQRVRRNHRD